MMCPFVCLINLVGNRSTLLELALVCDCCVLLAVVVCFCRPHCLLSRAWFRRSLLVLQSHHRHPQTQNRWGLALDFPECTGYLVELDRVELEALFFPDFVGAAAVLCFSDVVETAEALCFSVVVGAGVVFVVAVASFLWWVMLVVLGHSLLHFLVMLRPLCHACKFLNWF